MNGFKTQEVERKGTSILKVFGDSQEPLETNGGVGLTRSLGWNGRLITGIEVENRGMSTVIDYQNLIKFWEL